MDSRLQRLQQQASSGTSRRQRFAAQVIATEETEAIKAEEDNSAVVSSEPNIPAAVEAEDLAPSSSSSSSDDEDIQELLKKPSRPLLKPVFVPKELRGKESVTSEEILFATGDVHSRDESKLLAAELIKRDFEAERSAASGDSLSADPLSGVFDPNSVDDTDDPEHFEEEYLAWRLRELLRIKDERSERERWDREKEEIDRIRNMTEEERRKLDAEKQAQWEDTAKSQYKFLQKYYHKGAFYQEEHKDLLERDYAQPTGTDRNDKDVLPEFMQVRNFGKKGRGKWKHLTAEDTTTFDYGWGAKDNSLNQSKISQMGGMRGDLDHPAKKSKQ